MSSLANQQQNLSFPGLLQIPGGITSTLQQVQDGNGNLTALSISNSGSSIAAASDFIATKNGTAISGVVSRLISDGFGDLLSVKDFGAVGNGVADDTAAIQAAVNYVATLTGSKRLFFPAGVYSLASGAVTIPFCADLVLDAEAASFINITGSNSGFIITDGSWNHYLFGEFSSNSTGSCVLCQPTSLGGGSYNTYTWRKMQGTAQQGYGFRVHVAGGSYATGVSVCRVFGGETRGFNIGFSLEADNTTGGNHNIDTFQININYLVDNNISCNVARTAGAMIDANVWNINYEASFAGAIGFKSNGLVDIIYGTVFAAAGGILNQLDSGADANQFYLNPPEKTQIGSFSFPGSTYLVNNSGRTTNSGTRGFLAGSSSSVHLNNVNQTGIANNTWTKVLFNSTGGGSGWDDYGLFNATTNRWVPSYIGRALISAAASWVATVDTTLVEIAVYKNGVAYKTTGTLVGGSNTESTSTITCAVNITAETDYFEIWVRQLSGVSQDLYGFVSLTWAQFQIARP